MDGGSWRTGGRDQDHPQEKEMQKGKVAHICVKETPSLSGLLVYLECYQSI